jgi:hypothetical protein
MRQSLVVVMAKLLPFTIVVALPLGSRSFSTLPSTAIPGRRCAVRAGISSPQQESQRGQRHRRRRGLFGIKEWRAEMQQRDLDQNSPHSVWLLPFQASDVLLIGEKRTIVLNDGRFFDLFQDVLDQEHSIMGMALMGDDFLLPTIVLCEISDYQIDTGFRGRISIQATLESVGRAEMTQLLQMKPVMKATCKELLDDDEDDNGKSLLSAAAEAAVTPRELVVQDQAVKKLETEIVEMVSSLRSAETTTTTTTTLQYNSLEELSWIALALVRPRCCPNELMESFLIRNVKRRLEAVRRLLRRALVVDDPPTVRQEEGSLIRKYDNDEESSAFQ